MEIYKDLSNPASKEFEQLLNSQLSKNKIEEGKVIDGKINKTLTLRANNLLNDDREQVYKWLGKDTLIFNSYSPGITFSLGYSLKF